MSYRILQVKVDTIVKDKYFVEVEKSFFCWKYWGDLISETNQKHKKYHTTLEEAEQQIEDFKKELNKPKVVLKSPEIIKYISK